MVPTGWLEAEGECKMVPTEKKKEKEINKVKRVKGQKFLKVKMKRKKKERKNLNGACQL